MAPFDLAARLTAQLASTARLAEFAGTVLREIAALGFGAAWVAVLDDETGTLSTLMAIIDGVEAKHDLDKTVEIDVRRPLGHAFLERRMINITDPASLHIVEHDDVPVPSDRLVLRRASYDRLRGQPFACGPVLDSRREPVGAIALWSYRGGQPIPEALLSEGLLRVVMDLLGIAMERGRLMARLERFDASLLDAKAAIKAVREIEAAVAHDLNHYSGIALLAADIASRSPADAVRMLSPIKQAHRAIGDLVARLQRVARLSSSEGQAADLPQIVGDILEMMAPILREQSIEIDAEIATVPLVRCDAVLIHQVVLNLVLNARDALLGEALERRQIMIRVRDDGGVVRLVVTDNGPGIAPDVLRDLFQRNVSTKGAHHGVGLASARAALQAVGGRIDGKNAPTGGAVFEVTLIPAPPDASGRTVEPRLPRKLSDEMRRARILAVDDDVDVVTVIRASLEPQHEVATATSSAQAIEAAMAEPFDLVLCDHRMPKQTGVDVCRALREAGFRGKFVLMTGGDSQALGDAQRAAGIDELIKKPFGAMELVDVIQRLLSS